jgi:hypothetical protein
MSLTGFHLSWDMILSQNMQAVADQGCHSEGSSLYKGGPLIGGILYQNKYLYAVLTNSKRDSNMRDFASSGTLNCAL